MNFSCSSLNTKIINENKSSFPSPQKEVSPLNLNSELNENGKNVKNTQIQINELKRSLNFWKKKVQ